MTQRYESLSARDRMSRGLCPECGGTTEEHDGWGGPRGCMLTDTGMAQRVQQYRQDRLDEEQA